MKIVFKNDLLPLINKEIFFDGNLSDTRGLYVPNLNDIFVNLSAEQWKLMLACDFDVFAEEFSRTIIHEEIHKLIQEVLGGHFTNGEERVVKLLADQE